MSKIDITMHLLNSATVTEGIEPAQSRSSMVVGYIPLRLDLGQEAWPITRTVRGLIQLLGVSCKETRRGDQAGF